MIPKSTAWKTPDHPRTCFRDEGQHESTHRERLEKENFCKTATMSSVSDELISAILSSFKGVALIHSVAITRRFVYVQWTVGTEIGVHR